MLSLPTVHVASLFSLVLSLCHLCASSLPGTNSSSSDLGVMMGVGGVTLMSGMWLPRSSTAGGNVSTLVLVLSRLWAAGGAASASLLLLWWVWVSSREMEGSVSLTIPWWTGTGMKGRRFGLALSPSAGIPLVATAAILCVLHSVLWRLYRP